MGLGLDFPHMKSNFFGVLGVDGVEAILAPDRFIIRHVEKIGTRLDKC